MVDLTPFKEEIAHAMASARVVSSDPKGDFLHLLSSSGYRVDKIVEGEIVRVPDASDKGMKKSGWYVYREINDSLNSDYIIGIATYGSFKIGEMITWSSRNDSAMSRKERLDFFAAKESMKRQYDEERRVLNVETAKKAYDMWSSATDANPAHPYLANKRVKAHIGIKQDGDIILVPRANENNEIVNVERIYPDGMKKGLYGGQVKGTWYCINGNDDVVYVAEGYSTAASVHEATGHTVYASFNAGNLYEVVGLACSRHDNVMIAADNDYKNDINIGLVKAEQAADAYNISYVYPEGCIDFNDMHVAHGLHALTAYLKPKTGNKEDAPKKDSGALSYLPPMGVLKDIIAYYNATSGNKQPDFAMQTALAICSIILGRCYKTNYDNYSSLYLLNVAKSGTGKEHVKTVVEKILLESGMGHLVAGDGYTSAGAVFSELLNNPRHISIIDEFGRYLEAGRDLGRGTSHQREANTKLMEAIGRAHSVLRPPSYSTMTLKKEAAEELRNRYIHNPSITLMAMTTPDTLFKTLDMGAIKDGFVNRFIISISDTERTVRRHKGAIDVPETILRWMREVTARHGEIHLASEKTKPIEIFFTDEAIAMQEKFQQYCIDQANALERFGMSELTGRSNEMAMRLALIHALSKKFGANTIDCDDMAFGISYIRYCYERTVKKLKMTISSSDFEGHKKEVLADMREKGDNGITWADMQKNTPYSKHKIKDLREILSALKDAELAYDEPYSNGGTGRPTTLWRVLK